MIKILIADDHTIIRQGLRSLIEKTDDIELVAECSNGKDALEAIIALTPDVALLDISMPEIDGITLAGKLVKMNSKTRLVILTTHEDPLLYERALNAGIHGYLLKNNAFEELVAIIRNVASGICVMPKPASHSSTDAMNNVLTDREREVLGLIAHGLTNRMIAEALSLSVKTVDSHRSNLMMKLGLHATAELVSYAYKTGLV
jgi:DNA-binding NarL/FixJ family response regulator